MKSILISCVNFNTYKVLIGYLNSIEIAAQTSHNRYKVVVTVVDNSVEKYEFINNTYNNFDLKVFPFHKNLGYMGGAVKSLVELGKDFVSQFDFIIISNVDITIAEDFFEKLISIDAKGIGWIAPSIFRVNNKLSNENPFLKRKPSKRKIDLYIFMYSHPWLYTLYNKLYIGTRKVKAALEIENEVDIFAGMGSIFIFTTELVKKTYPLFFPSFMYGEELYYGELVKQNHLRVVFKPEIKVYDIGGVSTGSLGYKSKCRMNSESLSIISRFMYPCE